MGGINPLAPPPFVSPPVDDEVERKESTSESVEQPVDSPTSVNFAFETGRQGSKDLVTAPPVNPPAHESEVSALLFADLEAPARKDSTKSVESGKLPDPVSQQDHEDGEY